jgi:hypothetical protein
MLHFNKRSHKTFSCKKAQASSPPKNKGEKQRDVENTVWPDGLGREVKKIITRTRKNGIKFYPWHSCNKSNGNWSKTSTFSP